MAFSVTYVQRSLRMMLVIILFENLNNNILQRPNLKNLSGDLNLSRGLNMVGST